MKLSDLKPAQFNPRKISKEAMAGLKASIEEFGNIADITYNQRTGNLISGHQRVKALKEKYGDLEIIKVENEHVQECYFIAAHDYWYPVYMVDWPLKKEKAANVAANNHRIAGEFVLDELDCLLDEIQTDDPVLYDDLNFGPLLEDVANAEILPPEPEKPPQEPTVDDDWVTFQLGEIKGKIFKDVALLIISELKRLQGATGSDKLTPGFELMAINSANTPIESLK